MAAANSAGDECVICLQKTEFQKFLSCGKSDERHKLCLPCIENIAEEQYDPRLDRNRKIVACPFCRDKTVLRNGDGGLLQTKFCAAELVCEDCCRAKDVEDQWWCKTCEKTTCGTCAMKKHREHQCNLWEKYDVPKECLALFKNLSRQQERSNELKQQIKEFCRTLEHDLLAKAEKKENYTLLVSNIEKAFGTLPLGRIKRMDVSNLEKKLKVVSNLIKSAKNFAELDAEKICENVKNDQFHIRIPPLDSVIDMFDKNKSSVETKMDTTSVMAQDGYSSDSELSQGDGFRWGPDGIDGNGLGYYDRIVAWETIPADADSAAGIAFTIGGDGFGGFFRSASDDDLTLVAGGGGGFGGGGGGFGGTNRSHNASAGGGFGASTDGGFGSTNRSHEASGGGGFGASDRSGFGANSGGGFGGSTSGGGFGARSGGGFGASSSGGFGGTSGREDRVIGGFGRGRRLARSETSNEPSGSRRFVVPGTRAAAPQRGSGFENGGGFYN